MNLLVVGNIISLLFTLWNVAKKVGGETHSNEPNSFFEALLCKLTSSQNKRLDEKSLGNVGIYNGSNSNGNNVEVTDTKGVAENKELDLSVEKKEIEKKEMKSLGSDEVSLGFKATINVISNFLKVEDLSSFFLEEKGDKSVKPPEKAISNNEGIGVKFVYKGEDFKFLRGKPSSIEIDRFSLVDEANKEIYLIYDEVDGDSAISSVDSGKSLGEKFNSFSTVYDDKSIKANRFVSDILSEKPFILSEKPFGIEIDRFSLVDEANKEIYLIYDEVDGDSAISSVDSGKSLGEKFNSFSTVYDDKSIQANRFVSDILSEKPFILSEKPSSIEIDRFSLVDEANIKVSSVGKGSFNIVDGSGRLQVNQPTLVSESKEDLGSEVSYNHVFRGEGIDELPYGDRQVLRERKVGAFVHDVSKDKRVLETELSTESPNLISGYEGLDNENGVRNLKDGEVTNSTQESVKPTYIRHDRVEHDRYRVRTVVIDMDGGPFEKIKLSFNSHEQSLKIRFIHDGVIEKNTINTSFTDLKKSLEQIGFKVVEIYIGNFLDGESNKDSYSKGTKKEQRERKSVRLDPLILDSTNRDFSYYHREIFEHKVDKLV